MTIDSNYISEYPSHRIMKDVSLYKGYTKLASRSYNTEQDTAAAFQFWKEIQLRRLLGSFGPDNVTTWISVFNGRDTKHYLCGISADDQTQVSDIHEIDFGSLKLLLKDRDILKLNFEKNASPHIRFTYGGMYGEKFLAETSKATYYPSMEKAFQENKLKAVTSFLMASMEKDEKLHRAFGSPQQQQEERTFVDVVPNQIGEPIVKRDKNIEIEP